MLLLYMLSATDVVVACTVLQTLLLHAQRHTLMLHTQCYRCCCIRNATDADAYTMLQMLLLCCRCIHNATPWCCMHSASDVVASTVRFLYLESAFFIMQLLDTHRYRRCRIHIATDAATFTWLQMLLLHAHCYRRCCMHMTLYSATCCCCKCSASDVVASAYAAYCCCMHNATDAPAQTVLHMLLHAQCYRCCCTQS